MYKIKLSPEERKYIVNSLKKISGQIQSVIDIIEHDKTREQTLVQLRAIKGGANRVCKDIISLGVLKNISDYNFEDLNKALGVILKD
jgi:DNA-binding FrmR family transcriptional regulator